MSARATFWAFEQMPRLKGDGLAIALLLKLADQANDEGISWPSRATLAKHIGCHRMTITKKARLLEELGLLSRLERTRDNGSVTSNVYRLHLGSVEGVLSAKGDISPPANTGGLRPPEPSQKESETASRPSRVERDAMWDVMVEVTGVDPASKNEKSRRGKVVKELLELGATPDDVRVRATRYRRRYPGITFTDTGFIGRWGECGNVRATPSPVESCPECGQSFPRRELREHRYHQHDVGKACTECGTIVSPEDDGCPGCARRSA